MLEAASPLVGPIAVGICWLAIAALALIPSDNAYFARHAAFPLRALGGCDHSRDPDGGYGFR